nr:hypothetical protein CFP56_01754 [Quercus suber]
MFADCSKLKFKSSTQLLDEMLLQDIEPIRLDDLCYSSSQLLRDATNTWEVDTSVKPLNVLFSSFLGNIAHDQMLKISLGNLVYDLHMAS